MGYLRDTTHYPRSAIWAACADFELEDEGGGVILVPRGHVICFMASFFHGGRPYMSALPRFHCFYLPEYSQSRALRNRNIKKRSPAKWTLQIRNAAHWSAPAPKKRFQSVILHVCFIGQTDGSAEQRPTCEAPEVL